VRLRGRYWELTVGTTRIRHDDAVAGNRPLTIQFSVTKTLGREPNKATISVTNLSPTRRQSLEDASEPQVELVAGYQEDSSHDTIFAGDAYDVYTVRTSDGVDRVTTVEAKDGGRSYRTATITSTFGPGVQLATVINACADAMGIGTGNTQSVAGAAELDSGGSILQDGIALEGPAWRALDRLCRSASLRWSVQQGVLQLRAARRAAETRAVRLSPGTGLIGSPSRSSIDPRTRKVSIETRSLLIPGIYPGRIISLESSEISGSYMCRSITYTGDSTANDWYADSILEDYET